MQISVVPKKIYDIRGLKVMLDFDLAEMYGVKTKVFKQAVKRNRKRFPPDFMFELTQKEFLNLRSQFVTSSWGGTRYLPMAFTEHGIAMVSSILNSEKAIQVNILIIRTFAMIRQYALDKDELRNMITKLEKKYKSDYKGILKSLEYLYRKKAIEEDFRSRPRIGFKQ